MTDSPADVAYRKLERRRLVWLAILLSLIVASFTADTLSGPFRLSATEVASVVLAPESAAPTVRTVVWQFRLPTAILALLIGAALGIAGAEMQTILNNPLASPYTLGVSAAAGFGAALALVSGVAGLSVLILPLSAFSFAMLSCTVIFALGRVRGGSTETIILGGVALSFLFNSGIALLQYIAREDTLQAIVYWLFGSLQGATWPKLGVVGGVLAVITPLLALRAWQLTALRLGDDHARSLGVNVRRLRLQTLIVVSILTAVAVCFAGTIGFIGLVAPHLGRSLVGEDQRFFMPASALLGALLLSAASIVSKEVIQGVIVPVGIVTAFIGVPFFAAIVLGRRRTYW